jgi:hypothetical protein
MLNYDRDKCKTDFTRWTTQLFWWKHLAITSDERTKRLLNKTTLTDDGEMVYRITNDGFAENAVYHATCMTNYLLKKIKDDSED